MKPWKDIYDLPKHIPVKVPDGESGPWKVYSYEVSKEAETYSRMRAAIARSELGRWVPAGTYKGLKRGGEIIMSNTPDEIKDCYDFFRNASGRVLINGLGLGIALDVILHKVKKDDTHAVTEVYVIEKSCDVINLVASTFLKDKRVHIILSDAFEYKPQVDFDTVYHDIWDNICSNNLVGMKKLHYKYGKRANWQGSWCREKCKNLKTSYY